MRFRLLNDGGYVGLERVVFPAIVRGEKQGKGVNIHSYELIRIGANEKAFGNKPWYFSFIEGEIEEVQTMVINTLEELIDELKYYEKDGTLECEISTKLLPELIALLEKANNEH